MRNKYKSIIYSLLLCSILNNVYASSDDYVESYTPGTSSKVGLLKAGLMGIGLMSMAAPVEAIPIKGFSGCYLGTIDPQDSPSMDYIKIKTIKSTPCNFYYNYTESQFTHINMTMNINCKDADCFNIIIPTVQLCSYPFSRYGTGYIADSKLLWDYQKTGQYEKFSLTVLHNSLTTSFDSKPYYTLDEQFANYMNTGKC